MQREDYGEKHNQLEATFTVESPRNPHTGKHFPQHTTHSTLSCLLHGLLVKY